jgi:hypothetical protein
MKSSQTLTRPEPPVLGLATELIWLTISQCQNPATITPISVPSITIKSGKEATVLADLPKSLFPSKILTLPTPAQASMTSFSGPKKATPSGTSMKTLCKKIKM